MNKKEIITKKDLFYWLLISISISVIMASIEFHKDYNIVSHIGFAGTLISIILAVVAIIYSFFQNFTYSNINNQLINTSENIEKLINSLQFTSIDYAKKNEDLIINYDNYTKSLHTMIEDKFDLTKSEISAISNKLENFKSNQVTEKDQVTNIHTQFKKNEIESFLNNTSTIGVYLIYLVKQFHLNKIKFDRREVFKEVFEKSSEYALGFFVGIKTLGLLSSNYIDENYEEIKYMNEHAKELVGEKIDDMETKKDYIYRQKINDLIKKIKDESNI
ncbi:hypothetical protein JWG41_02930 [Leptospira sp. 201903075]|uniref:hypothetical protein n=1 Tax=Leptospira chreensis TaxID=2810035 RepID=UPI00196401EB|nr:hypothetical protein [Leptospira chreensis]MBM9589384.1 hypothetical protein [Leptospira chreensis]